MLLEIRAVSTGKLQCRIVIHISAFNCKLTKNRSYYYEKTANCANFTNVDFYFVVIRKYITALTLLSTIDTNLKIYHLLYKALVSQWYIIHNHSTHNLNQWYFMNIPRRFMYCLCGNPVLYSEWQIVHTEQTRYGDLVPNWCWASVADWWPTLTQHRLNVFFAVC